MTAAAAICLVIGLIVYAQLAVGFGIYMYMLTKDKAKGKEEEKQTKLYSVAAGLFFPITFAIIVATKAAEREKK